MSKQPVYYMQSDPRWANIPYTIDNDPKETIGHSGCGPTCAAMLLATWGHPEITPPDMAKLAIQLGDRTANDGTAWSFYGHIAQKYGFDMQQTRDFDTFISALKSGALVICSMGPKSKTERGYFTTSGHFILAWGIDPNGDILVNDPISAYRTDRPAPAAIFKSTELNQFFIFRKKEANIMDSATTMTGEQAIDYLASKGRILDPDLWKTAIKLMPQLQYVFIKWAKDVA